MCKKTFFTLAELMAVLIMTTIFAVIVVAGTEGMKKSDEATLCMNNLRKLGSAVALYLADSDDYFFPPVYAQKNTDDTKEKMWMQIIAPYLGAEFQSGNIKRNSLWACPAQLEWDAENPLKSVSYAYNAHALWTTPWTGWGMKRNFRPKLSHITDPEDQLVLVDSWWGNSKDNRNHRKYGRAYPADQSNLCFRHTRKANTLYANGSVMAEDHVWLYMGHPHARYPWNTCMTNKKWAYYGRNKKGWPEAFGYEPYE